MTVFYICGADQILDLHTVALLDDLGNPAPVAVLVVAFIAEQAHRAGLLYQR